MSAGAVVRLGEQWLVIAVPTVRFDHAGASYMGISTQAPVYRAMEGRAAGESFTFQGRNVTVHAVHCAPPEGATSTQDC